MGRVRKTSTEKEEPKLSLEHRATIHHVTI
jgi:hypothetical protein